MNTDGATGNPDGTRETRSCARTYLQSTQYDPTPRLGQEDISNKNAGKCPSLPRLALPQPLNLRHQSLSLPTPKNLPQQQPPCSLESLARSPGRNIRTCRACLSAGHAVATPSPTRATALSAKDIDIGSRAGHGTSDTTNRQTRDRDTRRWSARRGSVLFSSNQQCFLSLCVVRCCCLPGNLAR
jgi:hypothetical protein